MKEIKEYLNKWKDIVFIEQKTQHSEDINSLQVDLQIECNSFQNPARGFFLDKDKLLKFIWKCKNPRRVNTILKRKNKVEVALYLILRPNT